MLPSYWESKNLIFSTFNTTQAELAKSLFASNHPKVAQDHTFRDWPICEYEALISKSALLKRPEDLEAFYLRKISTKEGDAIGYIQLELNFPEKECLWIPMLCLTPKYQGRGLGKEIVDSTLAVALEYAPFDKAMLNVYVENIDAFRFWFKQGFNQIEQFDDTEHELGRDYHCIVLSKGISR
ncbi:MULTISPECIES: N-acetyltransferase [Vibrio]|uniref:GNAT family N-acetyltransferase n=1 Tax=Vibrio TaxID=662 RepID=UPI0005EF3568|nr:MULTISPECIES: GNAT family N-acetyltransferase [Vibrio]MDK9776545.1 GNAT family N-acetyltransferase [Vibrio sp. D401a]MDK9805604.1 GNAT family N-acetyltransferase [Vibrio sp. D406a]